MTVRNKMGLTQTFIIVLQVRQKFSIFYVIQFLLGCLRKNEKMCHLGEDEGVLQPPLPRQ